jgi:flagellar biosynthesis protein FlhG
MRDRKNSGKRPTILSVTSGKGGVGKTLTTVNFALAGRKMGLRVLILDGDLGLANVDVVLGLQARYNIRDVLDGHVTMQDVIVTGPAGINLIPSGSGIASLQQLSPTQKRCLADQLAEIEYNYDLILIDTGAGISDTVLHLNRAASAVVIVTTPEPHAMTDAYAMAKVLSEVNYGEAIGIVVNMTKSQGEGRKVFERIAKVAKEFIGLNIEYLGSVPTDSQVSRSILLRKAINDDTCHMLSGQAWNQIASQIIASGFGRRQSVEKDHLWSNLLWSEHVGVSSLAASVP